MRNAAAFVLLVGLTGCASQRLARDPLCREIAAFANSSKPGTTHVVTLETVWGPTKADPDSLRTIHCEHGGYEPGVRLCRYLIENSSAEFPQNNFRYAFACLSGTPAQTQNYVSYERLDVRVSAYGAVSVRDDVELSLEFKPDDANGTMRLAIGARAYGAKR